jgi:two-component sensor histidine kinase
MLRTEAVQNVALALHELATNALKYGALSLPAGKVNIDWTRQAATGPDEPNLRLIWRESGGPPVEAPGKKGFGCFVLERVTINALGEGSLEFKSDGLVWTCIIKPEHLVSESEKVDAPQPPQVAASNLQPQRLN